MAEDIKGLIEKIKREGIQAAQESAQAIEAQAKAKAEDILKTARAEAERIISEAKENINREQASSQELLKQAARDMIIELKKEIENMLGSLISERVREAFNPQEAASIIKDIIINQAKNASGSIQVELKKSDLDALEKGFIAELKEKAKKEIILKPSDEITGGFIISYDSGKSYFDFTDRALAEYIGNYLKPKLSEILEGVKNG